MPSSIREASDSADLEDRDNDSSDDNEVSNIATSGQQHGVVSPWRIGSMGDMSDLDLDS
jgi:aspartate aminotransferase-like enzyme